MFLPASGAAPCKEGHTALQPCHQPPISQDLAVCSLESFTPSGQDWSLKSITEPGPKHQNLALLHVLLTQIGSFHFQDLGATCKARKSSQLPHWASYWTAYSGVPRGM